MGNIETTTKFARLENISSTEQYIYPTIYDAS